MDKSLEKEIYKSEERSAILARLAKVMARFQTYDVIRQMHIDWAYLTKDFKHYTDKPEFNMGLLVIRDYKVSFTPDGVFFDQDYDLLVDKAEALGVSTIQHNVQVLAKIDDFEFIMERTCAADIPRDIMILLGMLGKTHTEHTEAHAATSVFCPQSLNSDELPF